MKLSVIVPTMNRSEDIVTFVDSLARQTCLPNELLIVDQSDNDATLDTLDTYKSHLPFELKYIRTREKSLTRAKNLAVSHVDDQTDLVAFFDDDIELFEDFIQQMVLFFKNDSKQEYAIATGIICHEAHNKTLIHRFRSAMISIDALLCRLFILGSPGNGKFKINGSPSFYNRSINSTTDVEVISGGVSVFRKEILNTFKFDGNMKTYCYMEDVDTGYRISRKYQNALVPAAKVYHHHSPVSRSDKTITRSQFIQNYCYLFHKNIPKNFLTCATFIWSIAGLIVIALCELQFRSIFGYIKGLWKVIFNQYDSLYPDWEKALVQYK
jgi:GT2 family glycosyltransferase